jgi:hypothetical protein
MMEGSSEDWQFKRKLCKPKPIFSFVLSNTSYTSARVSSRRVRNDQGLRKMEKKKGDDEESLLAVFPSSRMVSTPPAGWEPPMWQRRQKKATKRIPREESLMALNRMKREK